MKVWTTSHYEAQGQFVTELARIAHKNYPYLLQTQGLSSRKTFIEPEPGSVLSIVERGSFRVETIWRRFDPLRLIN